jgi:hypothetical protein
MGKLLVTAVQNAPVAPEFYSRMAAALIAADQQSGGTFAAPLKSAFVRRGMLATQNAVSVGFVQGAHIAAAVTHAVELPLQAIDGAALGLGNTPLFVNVASQTRRLAAITSGRGKVDENGNLPAGATHEIIGTSPSGLPIVVRRRFYAAKPLSGNNK